MCMFCAAIPMSVALGTAVTAKQAEKRRQAIAQGKRIRFTSLPVGKFSMAVTGGLILGSVVYHLVIMPRTGAVM
jgi:hypothetical protein